MGKFRSQIMLAIVCAILGFILAYEFRVISKQSLTTSDPNQSSNITVEIEQLKKQKDELDKKVTDLQGSITKYETEIADNSGTSKELLNQLNDTRMLLGETDVQGPGLRIDIAPKSNIAKSNPIGTDRIADKDLIYLINELNFAQAEAISINGIRITSRTGIRNAADYILVGDDKISPLSPITIYAIGDKNLLNGTFDFQGELLSIQQFSSVTYQKVDNITISKANTVLKTTYAKPVNK
jgi:uncharacterized protein YlxW (UPF0749 family)